MKRFVELIVMSIIMFFAINSLKAEIGGVEFLDKDNHSKYAFESGNSGSLQISCPEKTEIVNVTVKGSKGAVIYAQNPATVSGKDDWSTNVKFEKNGWGSVTVVFRQTRSPEIRYSIKAVVYILLCDYTLADQKKFAPGKPAKIEFKHVKDIIYNINVKPTADKTMKAVNDKLPNEPALFTLEQDMKKWQKTLTKATREGCPTCGMFLDVYHCCYKAPAEMTLEWRYKLPKWVEVDNASQKAQTEWSRFYKALGIHEKGHKTIAEAYHKDLLTLLKIIGIGKSHHKTLSKDLAYKAFNLSESQYPEYAERQANYDETTQHGRTQGVFLNIGIKLK